MIDWDETPSTPPFIDWGGRVYMEDLCGYDCTESGLYLYLPYLQYSSKLPQL
jgi:hypothetical protein